MLLSIFQLIAERIGFWLETNLPQRPNRFKKHPGSSQGSTQMSSRLAEQAKMSDALWYICTTTGAPPLKSNQLQKLLTLSLTLTSKFPQYVMWHITQPETGASHGNTLGPCTT